MPWLSHEPLLSGDLRSNMVLPIPMWFQTKSESSLETKASYADVGTNISTVSDCHSNLMIGLSRPETAGGSAHLHDLLKSTQKDPGKMLFWLLSQLVLSVGSFSH